MYSIIPLAGPDLYLPERGFRPLIEINGIPLLKLILDSRSWIINGETTEAELIFVLRDIPNISLLKDWLKTEYPLSQTVTLSDLTAGALMSALAGTSLIKDFSRPIVIDLADLLFASSFSPLQLFRARTEIVGIIPYFISSDRYYSYLTLEGEKVINTAEKKVISSFASAGTYFFRNLNCLLVSAVGSISNYPEHTVNGVMFVCPAFNWLLNAGDIIGIKISDVQSYSKDFHNNLNKSSG